VRRPEIDEDALRRAEAGEDLAGHWRRRLAEAERILGAADGPERVGGAVGR
jgi:hypothetical protein